MWIRQPMCDPWCHQSPVCGVVGDVDVVNDEEQVSRVFRVLRASSTQHPLLLAIAQTVTGIVLKHCPTNDRHSYNTPGTRTISQALKHCPTVTVSHHPHTPGHKCGCWNGKLPFVVAPLCR